ncbi:hypothetical protein ANME2D_00266 [Candidatus Methanoperedens nitroreducens]|uniref:Uncharacterized protein n=1 Tax=Candidatus Methanoperedens nitratireducens TaxID=1392998 RepID=A0A062V262_9EURY|nr:hypothetical protein [Candidatus Methanoperedens nitroreducens]KCZ73206.1 hypothetical protein ANME2D_00266 [Candidatus Methanoperedens nitroreducens]MDJ1422845.1 hypothetical protein [Candidatus Methanoperedens sp.]
MITGTAEQKQDIDMLINAISELKRDSPDKNKIKEGLLYLDNSAGVDIRYEIKTVLQKAVDRADKKA